MILLKVKKILSNIHNIVIAIVSFIVILEGMYIVHPDFSLLSYVKNIDLSFVEDTQDIKDLREYAEIVIGKCADKTYKPACFDTEIPKLMDYISMEEAFDVTRIVQETNPEYLYCHVLGHNLSRRESQKDPSKWREVLTRCPTSMCNNGCLHGSMMERFNAESLTDAQIEELKPDIKDLCEPRDGWHPVAMEISMCYHSIGHLNMFITNADIDKSLELCEWVGKKDDGTSHVQTCTHGVFMSLFQPLEPEDFALVADITPKKEDVIAFCEPYKEDLIQWEACRMEAWPYFRVELSTDPAYADEYCSFSGDTNIKKTCLSNVMSFVTLDFFVNNDPNKAKGMDALGAYCSGLSTPYYEANCYAHAAARLVQLDPIYTDLAMDVCAFADGKNAGDECYETLSHSGNMTYHPGTKEIHEYCSKMPDTWKDHCLAFADQKLDQ